MSRETLHEILQKLDPQHIPLVVGYINRIELDLAKYRAAYEGLCHEIQHGLIVTGQQLKQKYMSADMNLDDDNSTES